MRQGHSSTTSCIGARAPGGPSLAVAELEPADGVGQADRAHRTRRRAIGYQHRATNMERFTAEGRRERAPRVDRRKLAADQLDLADERGIGPGLVGRRPTDAAQHLESVQRQRPLRRRRWCGSGSAVRREECPGRPEVADRRCIATTRPSRRIGGGRTSDDRHAGMVGAGRQRRLIAPSTLCTARICPCRPAQAGRRKTYPTPRTVWMNAGCPGSSSICERSQWTWTSTVRVSPA
jgi:hypothetical protein